MFEQKVEIERGEGLVTPFFLLVAQLVDMKLLQNINRQPLLQLSDGQVINLNTLQNTNDPTYPVKAGNMVAVSKHHNNNFIDKAAKLFSVSRVKKAYGKTTYLLESNFYIICVIQGDTVLLLGNYPIYYLKLLYRYINSL